MPCLRLKRPGVDVRRVCFGLLEHLDILEGALLPREVLLHAPHYELLPAVAVVSVGVERVPQTKFEALGVSTVKLPTGTVSSIGVLEGIVLYDRVLETTRSMHDGHSPVPLSVQLGQAARLVTRRHQKNIGSGNDLVLELALEADVAAHLGLGFRV